MSQEKDCLNCGETITRTYESKKRWENRKYCSQSCQLKFEYSEGERDPEETVKKAQKAARKKGMKSFRENPSKKDWRGWRMIYIPTDHPDLEKGWMLEHHFVWWKNTEELPPEDKVVHHKDGNKKNNDFDNLQLVTPKEHAKIHNDQNKLKTKKCEICGAAFEYYPSKSGNRVVCSRKCQIEWQKENR